MKKVGILLMVVFAMLAVSPLMGGTSMADESSVLLPCHDESGAAVVIAMSDTEGDEEMEPLPEDPTDEEMEPPMEDEEPEGGDA